MSGFEQPNYTQTPNAFYDKVLKDVDSMAELKVTLAVIRHTMGFHRYEHELSLSYLVEYTGLHRETVIDGLKRAMKRGTVTRRESGNTFAYSMKVVGKSDQKGSRKIRPKVVGKSDPRKKEKESTPTGDGKPPALEVKSVQAAMLADLYERLRDRGMLEKRPLTNAYKGRLAGEIREYLKTREVGEVWEALDRIVYRWRERALSLTDAFNDFDQHSGRSESKPERITYDDEGNKLVNGVLEV